MNTNEYASVITAHILTGQRWVCKRRIQAASMPELTASSVTTYPCVLEGPLVHLSCLLLELLDDTLVNASQLVNQVTSGGGLAGVHMSNDHNVQMSLFLTHLGSGDICNEKVTT